MMTKKEQRLRRARQTRIRIADKGVARLSVNRTNLHIYATVVSEDGCRVLASASTAEADMRKELGAAGKGGNVAAAQQIGKRIAERAKAAAVEKWLSIARVSRITAASRPWPTPPVKRVCSSKKAGQTNGKVSGKNAG